MSIINNIVLLLGDKKQTKLWKASQFKDGLRKGECIIPFSALPKGYTKNHNSH